MARFLPQLSTQETTGARTRRTNADFYAYCTCSVSSGGAGYRTTTHARTRRGGHESGARAWGTLDMLSLDDLGHLDDLVNDLDGCDRHLFFADRRRQDH